MSTDKDEISFIKISNPTGCHLWNKDALTNDDLKFEVIETYEEGNHFERRLLKCALCGQYYYFEFYEQVDWDEGNDKIFSTYIPICLDRSLIEILNKRSPLELLSVTPCLRYDSNDAIKWIR